MNKSVLIGRLAADPELKQTANGIAVTSFTVAVERKYKSGDDKITDWIDCVAWRNTAEFLCKYFGKGSPIVVEGSIQTRFWEDKNGLSRKAVEILAENIEFVPKTKHETNGAVVTATAPQAEIYSAGCADDFTVVDDGDWPF